MIIQLYIDYSKRTLNHHLNESSKTNKIKKNVSKSIICFSLYFKIIKKKMIEIPFHFIYVY